MKIGSHLNLLNPPPAPRSNGLQQVRFYLYCLNYTTGRHEVNIYLLQSTRHQYNLINHIMSMVFKKYKHEKLKPSFRARALLTPFSVYTVPTQCGCAACPRSSKNEGAAHTVISVPFLFFS